MTSLRCCMHGRGLRNSKPRDMILTNLVRVFNFVVYFYPRDAMLARVFATATCLSVCLSVCTPVLCLAERKQDREMYTI